MTAFGDKWRKSGGGSTASAGGGDFSGGSLASIWRKDKSGGSIGGARLIEANRARDEEIKRQEIERQQEAINQFRQKQEEIQRKNEGNIFDKAKSLYQGVKSWLGYGETLPELPGGSPVYQAERATQLAEQEYKKNWGGRFAIAAENLAGGVKNYFQEKKELGEKSVQERGRIGTAIESGKGAVKNIGELASGAGKLALEFSPLTGMSGIRKIVSFVGGKPVEEFLDRNIPEYQKKVDAFVDSNGILNYKAKYSNEIQKTGGEVAEIGSWFIPITRAGKAEKIEQAIAEIPRVARLLGATPKVVKVGGKLMYEVSKDVVDVAVLDQLRGKTWDETKEDLKTVAVGGAALRTLGGAAGLLLRSRQNRLVKSIEAAIPDMDDAERKVATELAGQGKPIDDIATEIYAKREQAGKDIFVPKPEVKVEKPKAEIKELKTKKIPISKLKSIEGDRDLAMADFMAGKKSKTNLPVLARLEPDGSYTVLDGNGRIIEAEKAGKSTIEITTNESLYRKLTEEANKVVPSEKVEVPKSQLPIGQGEKTGKSTSPIIERINQNLDEAEKLNPALDTTNHKQQAKIAGEEISKNPQEAYNKALYGDSKQGALKTTLLTTFLEKAKEKGDMEAIGKIGTAFGKHGRRAGQEIEMIKAMVENNPTNKLLMDLARTKLANVEARYPKLAKIARESGKDVVEQTKDILKRNKMKLGEAQKLINSLVCK